VSDLLADDFELVQPTLLDAGVYRGAPGLRRWYAAMADAWREMRWELEEMIEADEFVVVVVRFASRGAHTDIEQATRRYQTIRVRAGRVAFATGYATLEQAREAVGLEP
jgi:SnoaL-like domain